MDRSKPQPRAWVTASHKIRSFITQKHEGLGAAFHTKPPEILSCCVTAKALKEPLMDDRFRGWGVFDSGRGHGQAGSCPDHHACRASGRLISNRSADGLQHQLDWSRADAHTLQCLAAGLISPTPAEVVAAQQNDAAQRSYYLNLVATYLNLVATNVGPDGAPLFQEALAAARQIWHESERARGH